MQMARSFSPQRDLVAGARPGIAHPLDCVKQQMAIFVASAKQLQKRAEAQERKVKHGLE
jgi:hypothetical protein